MKWTHERTKAKPWKGRGSPVVAQEKLDGWRVTVFHTGHDTYACGRDPTRVLTEIYPSLLDDPVFRNFRRIAEPYSSLDCEYVVPGQRASSVVTALKEGTGHLVPFAFPWWGGVHLRDVNPLDIDTTGFPFARMEPYDPTTDYHNLAMQAGIEGFILKEANDRGWYKIKTERTVDCVVVDVQEGKGKYAGEVGALVVALEGDVIANVSGMTDDARWEMTENSPIGKVVEVKYQYVGDGGRLRHPRFIRFRPDKSVHECTKEQL